MILNLNRANYITDGIGRPLSGSLTVEQAAAFITTHDAELPAYMEARFRVTPGVHVPIERQMADKLRRLRKIAAGCGRNVVRVEARRGMDHMYCALLAR